ncbi:MAG: dienelactone hydrolase family protein [Chloroflexi bacterium]|nr:dienelactone hydrolase family protein [Chloroflexota bacterium]MBP7045634.1 dienelactone hydrolase family protein [Chloroflexota bacterium]
MLPDLFPHQKQPVLHTGAPLAKAKAAMILVHGRGATAESILTLAPEFDQPDWAYLAPQAAGNTWYPYSFLAPMAHNEPGITSGLTAVSDVLATITRAGIPPEKVALLGFSQGACLALEFAARRAQRYGAVIGLSGGLIGPDGTPRDYEGWLGETAVFLGCSDVDFHIPQKRVAESAEVFQKLGGAVTMRLYPGMGHTINQDELDVVRALLQGIG